MAENNTTASQNLTLDQDQVKRIRNALIIGLTSYGEIERIINWDDIMKASGRETDLNPIHPTGNADTVSVFAEALAYVS